MGPALMGTGQGVGENRATEAVNAAIASPLLQDISIDGAVGVLVNISARRDSLGMAEVTEATTKIYEEAHDDANIILGVMFDESLGEAMRVTVVATGINSEDEAESLPSKVTPLGPKPQAEDPHSTTKGSGRLPGGGGEVLGNEAGAEKVAPEKSKGQLIRRKFSQPKPIFDEDRLDIPTYMRRDEN